MATVPNISENVKSPIFHVVVVSGKGGVGKTSISASIACALKDAGVKILTADTDVDAPNLEILFQTGGKIKESFHVKTTEKASFLPSECIHCKQCIDDNFCNFHALSWNEEESIPIIDPIACEGCKACQLLCPQTAFDIQPVNSGTIKHLSSQYDFPVITGETILGAQTSGKLVTELKKYAESQARDGGYDFILIDGPPGIGCPVIAAVAEVQLAIVVIEPTLAALHDAKRVMNVIDNFHIPIAVIINKSDMWAETLHEIREFLKDENIPILGEIPLDTNWPHSIAKGLPIIKAYPDSSTSQILGKIAETLLKHQQNN